MDAQQTAGALAALNSEPAKELGRQVGQIFSNLLGPVKEQLCLTLGDYAAYYRLTKLDSVLASNASPAE